MRIARKLRRSIDTRKQPETGGWAMARPKRRRSGRSFTHVLINDVKAAQHRVRDAASPTHRRELVRSVFAAIEGLHWQLK
jgi:hypothetical protein